VTGSRPSGGRAGCVAWSSAGRPRPGESESGDLAVHVELEDGVVVAVVDGLGHGPEAAAAATRARGVIEATAAGAPVDELLRRVHEALARTRGVVMTIASIGCSGLMRWVGVGNVEAHVVRSDGGASRRAASAVLYGGVLGYRLPDVKVSTVELEPGDLVLMATDGIDPDFADTVSPADTVEQLTARILERCARPDDDALVAAARYRGPSS
jgi:cell wall-associated NlpC family hydrolase